MAYSPNNAARTEIIRVRVTEKQKSLFARCSAELGLASATHAYGLVLDAMQEHLSQRSEAIKGATCWPLSQAGSPPIPKGGRGCRSAPMASRASGKLGVRRQL